MKLFTASALVALVAVASAFQPVVRPSNGVVSSSTSLLMASSSAATPCDTPDIAIPEGVTANVLRSAVLTNADGESIRLGDKMGSGVSVVIFLRHMG